MTTDIQTFANGTYFVIPYKIVTSIRTELLDLGALLSFIPATSAILVMVNRGNEGAVRALLPADLDVDLTGIMLVQFRKPTAEDLASDTVVSLAEVP